MDLELFNIPVLVKNVIEWRDEEYTIGTGVFLKPETYIFKNKTNSIQTNNVILIKRKFTDFLFNFLFVEGKYDR